jgi:hypothetical protein
VRIVAAQALALGDRLVEHRAGRLLLDMAKIAEGFAFLFDRERVLLDIRRHMARVARPQRRRAVHHLVIHLLRMAFGLGAVLGRDIGPIDLGQRATGQRREQENGQPQFHGVASLGACACGA